MRNRFAAITLGTLSLVSVPCQDADADRGHHGNPWPYVVDESHLPFDALPGTTTTRYWGIHKRAGYKIEIPDNWNGRLVVFSHGFRSEDIVELTADPPPFRAWLVANGYAWATSTYSVNGYDVKTATQDTLDIPRIFSRLAGPVPGATYAFGESMGGHVTALAIEKSPQTFDGAMSSCGVLGDYELFDYFLDFSLAGQALAGIPAVFPPDPLVYFGVTVPAVKAALGPAFPFLLSPSGTDFKNLVEQRTGGDRPVYDTAFLFWNGAVPNDFLFSLGAGDGSVLPKRGKVAVDNFDTVYQFDGDLTLTPSEQALNDEVLRVSMDPGSRHSQVVIDGRIRVPVLTLHGLGDLFVPFSMEQDYARKVAARGKSHLLVQRAIREQLHCSFTEDELGTGLADLVSWVEDGVKPDGDDVLDPAVVSAPDYGCTYTSDDRLYPAPFTIPPCP